MDVLFFHLSEEFVLAAACDPPEQGQKVLKIDMYIMGKVNACELCLLTGRYHPHNWRNVLTLIHHRSFNSWSF